MSSTRGRTTSDRAWACTVAVCGLLLCAPAARAQQVDGSSPAPVERQFHITYLTSATAYVDAGRDDDVASGDVLEVVHAGKVAGTLTVTDVSSRRAACAIADASAPLAVGDLVRRVSSAGGRPRSAPATSPAGPTPPTVADIPAASAGPAPAMGAPVAQRQLSLLRAAGLRGRLGVRYLAVQDRSGLGGDISQPALDARLDGTRIGGSRFDLNVDVRARRTTQSLADGSHDHNGRARVYRLAGTYHLPGDHLELTVGRQFSSALATISTFDGVQAEYEVGRFGLGAFTGTQPEPIDYGFSTDIREHGLYLRLRGAPQAAVRWETAVAGIGSYEKGQLNREYVALLGQVASMRASLMLQQEIDFNRGWKLEAGEPRQALTSTFVSGRYRLTGGWDIDAGYDNRRNVRLYRDYVNPEIEFDDTYRQGIWGGSTVRFAQRYRLGGAVRTNSGGAAGNSNSYSLLAGANQVTPLCLQLRLRSTRYINDRTEGWMHSLSNGMSLGQRWYVEVFGGLRDEQARVAEASDASATWYGVNLDLGLGDAWYLGLSGERDERGEERYDQVYSSLSYRF